MVNIFALKRLDMGQRKEHKEEGAESKVGRGSSMLLAF